MTTNNTSTPNDNTLSPEEMAAVIECLLFVADQPVAISELATTLEATRPKIERALKILSESYRERYLQLQVQGDKVQLVTAPQATEYIETFLGLSFSSKLSTAALEVLGIIAYKQPLTRPEMEAIRGVSCDGVLRNLLSKGLIEEVGRLDTVGHPIQYGTTFEFLKYFGLSSLENLPELGLDEANADEDQDEETFEVEQGVQLPLTEE